MFAVSATIRVTFIVAVALLSAPTVAQQPTPDFERGKYLTSAGDCIACHSAPNGKPYAGGRAIETPFGVIYSPNITPDKETGIGNWTPEDLINAMQHGLGAHGNHLYPAFPYPYYTKVRADDIRAIYTYLKTLEPVHAENKPLALKWPLDNRVFMRGWNLLFFKSGEYQNNPAKNAGWNRGAYLVEGLGHCAACHTPKNAFGADDASAFMKGSNVGGWIAPNLSEDAMKGLRAWSVEDIAQYLKNGRNAFAQAGGPMGEVVSYSTSHMTDEDVRAIAIYLKDLPGTADKPASQMTSAGVVAAGASIYQAQCSACHQQNGAGVAEMFPALAGGGVTVQDDPSSTVRVLLEGARTAPTAVHPTPSSMPAFGWKLTDSEIAAVSTYVRNSWGNAAPAVTAGEVKSLRAKLQVAVR